MPPVAIDHSKEESLGEQMNECLPGMFVGSKLDESRNVEFGEFDRVFPITD